MLAAAGFDLRLFTSLTDCHELDTLPYRFQDKKKGKKEKEGRKERYRYLHLQLTATSPILYRYATPADTFS